MVVGIIRWLHDFGELVQARVRHGHQAGIGLDGAEGKVLGSDARLGQCIEQGRLAHVGETYDSAFEAHA